MSKGRVVESGRHVDLMSKEKGAYATLMRLQQSLPEPDTGEMKNANLDTATTLYMGQDGQPRRPNRTGSLDSLDGADSQLDTSSTISLDHDSLNNTLSTLGTLDTDAGLLGTVRIKAHCQIVCLRGCMWW